MSESLFGPLVGIPSIENAVLNTLRTWLPTYLAEVERQHGLPNKAIPRPPASDSYHGGLDFDAWKQDELPSVIVIVEPTGHPEKSASAGYSQEYEIQVGAVWFGTGNAAFSSDPEDEARLVAGYYGEALQLIAQQGALEGLVEETVMTGAPKVEMPSPEERQLARCIATFSTFISTIVNPFMGPKGETLAASEPELKAAEPEAPPGSSPVVKTTSATIEGEEL
jgi:hypothetical protein